MFSFVNTQTAESTTFPNWCIPRLKSRTLIFVWPFQHCFVMCWGGSYLLYFSFIWTLILKSSRSTKSWNFWSSFGGNTDFIKCIKGNIHRTITARVRLCWVSFGKDFILLFMLLNPVFPISFICPNFHDLIMWIIITRSRAGVP